MTTRIIQLTGIACVLLFLTSCGSYIGRYVDPSYPNICKFEGAQGTCDLILDDMIVELNVTPLAETNVYRLEGAVKLTNVDNFDTYRRMDMKFFFIQNDVVIDYQYIRLGTGELGRKVHFSKDMKVKKSFEDIFVSYHIVVQG